MSSATVLIGALRVNSHKMTNCICALDAERADTTFDFNPCFRCFSDKIMLEISCESSAWQRIHMKHQVLFSSK